MITLIIKRWSDVGDEGPDSPTTTPKTVVELSYPQSDADSLLKSHLGEYMQAALHLVSIGQGADGLRYSAELRNSKGELLVRTTSH